MDMDSEYPSEVCWTSQFEVGVPEIDEDHRLLIDTLNGLIAACTGGRREKMQEALASLEAQTLHHFAREEALIAQYSYEHGEQHREEHRRLYEEIGHQIEELGAQEQSEASIAHFMRNWLLRHIITADRHLGQSIKRRQDGLATA